MDVFGIRNRLIHDYASYIRSFIHLRDPIISKKVYDCLTEDLLWPDPLIQLNPAFEPGEWIEELVAGGVLHPECAKIFRIKPGKTSEGVAGLLGTLVPAYESDENSLPERKARFVK